MTDDARRAGGVVIWGVATAAAWSSGLRPLHAGLAGLGAALLVMLVAHAAGRTPRLAALFRGPIGPAAAALVSAALAGLMLHWDLARARLHATLLLVSAGVLAALAVARARQARSRD